MPYIARVEKLIKFWASSNFQRAPYIHKSDKRSLLGPQSHVFMTQKQFLGEWRKKRAQKIKRNLHVGLLPHPYCGDLKRAKVFILMLNPGFGILNYWEEKNSRFRKALLKNISQCCSREYPFIFLDPKWAWTTGGRYWLDKFEDLIRLAVYKKRSFTAGLKFLSQNIATVELFPYHSQSGPPICSNENGRNFVKSVKMVKDFVQSWLGNEIKRKAGNVKLVVMVWGGRHWTLQAGKKLILYKGQKLSFSMDGKNKIGLRVARALRLIPKGGRKV